MTVIDLFPRLRTDSMGCDHKTHSIIKIYRYLYIIVTCQIKIACHKTKVLFFIFNTNGRIRLKIRNIIV